MEETAQTCWRQVWRSQFDSSPEEKAFAQDGSGLLEGSWPPKSYSCSFCSREFRSAQALGGHMNVHRRDRAQLKQSLSTSNGETETLGGIISSSLSPSRVSAGDPNLIRENQKGCKESTKPWGEYLGLVGEKMAVSECLHLGPSRSTGCCGNEAISYKKLKMEDDIYSLQNDDTNSIVDIDLELRLGDPPAKRN